MLLIKNKFENFFLHFCFFYFSFIKFLKIFFNFFFFFNFLHVVRDLIFLKKKMSFFKKNKLNNNNIYIKAIKRSKAKKKKKVNLNKNFFFFKNNFLKSQQKTIDLKKKFYDLNLKSRKNIYSLLNFKNRLKFFKNKFFNFLKYGKNSKFFFFDFFIWYALLKNGFVLTTNDAFFLIKNNFIFLNGHCIKNVNYFLKLNDLIQIVIHTKFLIFIKNYNEILKTSLIKVKKKIWGSYKQKFLRINDSKNKLNARAHNLMHFKSKLLFFYEVDYFSFSFFLIYKPIFFFEHSFFFSKFINFFMFKLYGWKLLS